MFWTLLGYLVRVTRNLPQRGLIVRQPWISLILDGSKTWELRSRPTLIRGAIGLIAKRSGMVSGVATLTGCMRELSLCDLLRTVEFHGVPEDECESVWLAGWRFPWVLDSAARLEEPVEYSHRRGSVTWVKI